MVQQVAGENVDIKPRETKTFTWGVLSDSSQPRMSSVNSNEETSGEAGEEEAGEEEVGEEEAGGGEEEEAGEEEEGEEQEKQ